MGAQASPYSMGAHGLNPVWNADCLLDVGLSHVWHHEVRSARLLGVEAAIEVAGLGEVAWQTI